MNFFFSDPHFGHYKVILYASRPFLFEVKGLSIFFNEELIKTCENETEALNEAKRMSLALMEETMVTNWNNKVSANDTVYVCGDFYFGGEEIAKRVLARLNGKKILIEGNHDKSKAVMIAAGFSEVHETLNLKIGKHDVVMNHYPYVNSEFNHIAQRRPNIIKIHTKPTELPPIPEEFDYALSKAFLLKYHSYPINLSLDKEKKVFNYLKRSISTHIGSRMINEGKILLHGHTHHKAKRFANMINLSVEARNFSPVSETEVELEIEEYLKEISGDMINDDNCRDPVYDYYQNFKIPEFKVINELNSVYRSFKISVDQGEKPICRNVPQKYSKKWYDLNLTKNMFIPKKDLIAGLFYKGRCRNATVAYWDGEEFIHFRQKFAFEFLEQINCLEDDEGMDVFIPHEEIELSDAESLKFFNALASFKKN